MPPYAFPPDTRVTGQASPAADFDELADLVGLLYSLLGQLAGAGTNLDPGGNATNLAALIAMRTAAALAPGTAGTVLTSNGAGANPTFQPGATNPMTSPWDLIRGGTAGAPTRFAIGSNGQVLGVSAGALAWLAAFTSPLTTTGDLVIANPGATLARLGVGAAGTVLTSVGGLPAWAAAPASIFVVVQPSGDTSGASDVTAINTAIASLTNGGVVLLAPGLWYINAQITVPAQTGTGVSGGQGVSILGCGSATVVNCVGTGGLYCHRTAGYSSQFGLPAQHTTSFLRDFVLDGTNATSGCTGLDIGDGWGIDVAVTIVNFTASYSFSVTSGGVFTATGTAYPNNFPVMLTGVSGASAYSMGTIYYTTGVSGATFSLAPNSGGTAITSTSTGSGTVSGTVPFRQVNRVVWSEKGRYRCQLMNNSIAALLDTAISERSHEYNIFELNLFSNAGQQGVVCAGGTGYGGEQFRIYGNMSSLPAGLTTAQAGLAALSFQGSNGSGSYTAMSSGEIHLKVEGNNGNGGGTAFPAAIIFGSSGNGIQHCHGAIASSLSNSILNGGEFSFRGLIYGDAALAQAYPGAPLSGQTQTGQPSFPGLGAVQQNYGPDFTVCIAGGSLTGISVSGVATGLTSGAFFVPAGGTIQVNGTSAVGLTYIWVPAAQSAY